MNHSDPFWVEFVSGWIGGCAGLVAGHPMDTVKVRQQTLGNVSAIDGIIKTFKHEGMRGFYKGMGFPLLATGALNSLFFGSYSNVLKKLSKGREHPRYLDIFNAACVGGVVQLSVACPIDVVKIKMQIQTNGGASEWGQSRDGARHYKGPTSCLMDMYRTRGIRSWYHGLGSMAARDVPTFGLYMVLYEAMIKPFNQKSNNNPSSMALVFCGGMAGALSWATIVPVDVIKSRIQADSVEKPQYKNFVDCCRKSLRAEGPGVFFRGFSLVIARAFPTNSAIFLAHVSSANIIRQTLFSKEEAAA